MQQIHISAEISSPIQTVWEKYTSPEHIIHWNFASDDWCCPSATNDLKVGGKYCARMEAIDGSFGFDFEATYTALSIGNSFTYVMPDQRVVHFTIQSKGNATIVDIKFDPETENPIEMQKQGWQMILNNFKKYCEN